MPQTIRKRIHLIYGCILAALTAVLGIALILSVLDIYSSGPRAYSYESIGNAFWRISALVFVVIGGIIGGIVLNLTIPLENQRPKAVRDDVAVMVKLRNRAGVQPESAKQIKLRRIYKIGTAVLSVIIMIPSAIYLLLPFFPGWKEKLFTVDNLNGDIIRSVYIVMIPAVICLGLCFLCAMLVRKSLRAEADIYKKALAASTTRSPAPKVEKSSKTPLSVWVLRGSIVVVAVAFVVVGIINGGMNDVFTKAVAICTECIGLG